MTYGAIRIFLNTLLKEVAGGRQEGSRSGGIASRQFYAAAHVGLGQWARPAAIHRIIFVVIHAIFRRIEVSEKEIKVPSHPGQSFLELPCIVSGKARKNRFASSDIALRPHPSVSASEAVKCPFGNDRHGTIPRGQGGRPIAHEREM